MPGVVDSYNILNTCCIYNVYLYMIILAAESIWRTILKSITVLSVLLLLLLHI